MNAEKRVKTRRQSVYEYFEALQLEWIVADLRYRISTKIKDKEFWRRVKEGKKVTIETIADRNQLPTIFTDLDMRAELEKRVYRNNTYPNFLYRNEEDKEAQGYWDLFHYYKHNADIRFEHFGEVRVGKIKAYQVYDTKLKVVYNDEVFELLTSEVSRIL